MVVVVMPSAEEIATKWAVNNETVVHSLIPDRHHTTSTAHHHRRRPN